jgi:hypothetical protein
MEWVHNYSKFSNSDNNNRCSKLGMESMVWKPYHTRSMDTNRVEISQQFKGTVSRIIWNSSLQSADRRSRYSTANGQYSSSVLYQQNGRKNFSAFSSSSKSLELVLEKKNFYNSTIYSRNSIISFIFL